MPSQSRFYYSDAGIKSERLFVIRRQRLCSFHLSPIRASRSEGDDNESTMTTIYLHLATIHDNQRAGSGAVISSVRLANRKSWPLRKHLFSLFNISLINRDWRACIKVTTTVYKYSTALVKPLIIERIVQQHLIFYQSNINRMVNDEIVDTISFLITTTSQERKIWT